MAHLFERVLGRKISLPLPRLTFKEALSRYGSDKPDLRFGLEISEVTDIVRESAFRVFSETAEAGGVVAALAPPPGREWSRKVMGELEEVARRHGAPGLLWARVTDEGLEKCSRLLRFCAQAAPGTEVVVNDWGLLCLLKDNYPSFPASAGRVLNKGFKDPRLVDPKGAAENSEDAHELLNGCSFDTPSFQKKTREMDVSRFERDVLPYGEPDMKSTDDLGSSVYFPFGYVSTGRVCWVASFKASAGRKFSPSNTCHSPCSGLLLEMGGAQSSFRLFEGGNTVFYLYPPSVLRSFAVDPIYKDVRLVCQGSAI